jgi:hypothetical protein
MNDKKFKQAIKSHKKAVSFTIQLKRKLQISVIIMQDILDNPDQEFKKLHESRIKEFIQNINSK